MVLFLDFLKNVSSKGKRINTPSGAVNHSISHQSEMKCTFNDNTDIPGALLLLITQLCGAD